MATQEPVDPEIRQRVTSLLYGLLPELYRVWDEPPRGRGELRDFLHILAAPLAQVRQSVEALHADLFIDSCGDDMLPALAEMVGTVLVFPDAASNRRDLRSTATWRRRKGSVQTLELLAGELLDQLVTTQEGWKRLLITQDIRLPRPERTVADVRDPLLAERAVGPGETLFRAVDVRDISLRAGRYHPLHVTHWTHPTRLFPLRRGDARQLPGAVARYAFHPLGEPQPLRVDQREDEVRLDRVPPGLFARSPERFFGGEGGFSVHLCGLPAALGASEPPLRNSSSRVADLSLVEGGCTLHVLEREERGLTGSVKVDVFSVPVLEQHGGTWRPELTAATPRGGIILTAQTAQSLAAETAEPLALAPPTLVPMLRLAPAAGAPEAYFPGATVELVGASMEARRASLVPELAVEGFLRGALVARLPGLWLNGPRWLYVAADGSIHDAGTTAMPVHLLRQAGAFVLPQAPLAVGPGAAWPPTEPSAVDTPLTLLPPSPTHGPVVMHGGTPHWPAPPPGPVAQEPWVSLSFAAVDESAGLPQYTPLLRLMWRGANLASMSWWALGDSGQPTFATERFRAIAALARDRGGQLALAVRLETDTDGLVLQPCEVAWTPAEGAPLLLYLPELSATRQPLPGSSWPAFSPAARLSEEVLLHADGSSRWVLSKRVIRYALGPVAPLGSGAVLRRRRLRGRSLASSVNEPREGWLDVDPDRGLFALAQTELPPRYPNGTEPPRQGSAGLPFFSGTQVTVDYQEGYSGHVGARPAPREALLREPLPTPTRRVVRNGTLPSGHDGVPIYSTLEAALSAISLAPSSTHEVVQLEDSATYAQALMWPTDARLRQSGQRLELTVQAAEGQRPVLEFSSWLPTPDGTRFPRLTLRGLCLAGGAVVVPADVVSLQLCTVARVDQTLTFQAGAVSAEVDVDRCVTAGLVLEGQGLLRVKDSVVDAGEGPALMSLEGTCELERVTVLGATHVRVLEASEVILDGPMQVEDRFHGCVRYSRVPQGGIDHLPRPHRVVSGGDVRFVSRDRSDPAHARLAADADTSVVRGSQDGSEMGAFHHVRLAQRYEALEQRLAEYTPAGLSSGVLRLD